MRTLIHPILKGTLLLAMLALCSASDRSITLFLPAPVQPPCKFSVQQSLPVIPVNTLAAPSATAFGKEELWTGDFSGMLSRRKIRVLVPYNKNFFFLHGSEGKGLTYEAMQMFEKYLLKQTGVRVATVIIPVRRDHLLQALDAGLGDVAAAYLTVTPERQHRVDFTTPVYSGAREWVVTGPSSPEINCLEDLSGKEIYVRRSSSFYEHLQELNLSLAKAGIDGVQIETVDEFLEDEDLLELVNSGYLPATVVEDNIGRFWAKIFKNIRLRNDLVIDEDGEIAWAIRKDSPGFQAVLDEFIKKNRKGTLMGNILFNRYLKSTHFISALSESEFKKFAATVEYFKKYAVQYGLDWRMMIAQGYQESRLDQSARSHVGAVGIMQVRPSTAADIRVQNIHLTENNIHAGVKYSRFIQDYFFENDVVDELNKQLFVLASYNAGPNRIANMRRLTAQRGLNPNVWFNNVERVVAGTIGLEPVKYVSNIYKYYLSLYYVDEYLLRKNRKMQPPQT